MKTHKICKKGIGKASGYKGCGKELPVSNHGKPNFVYGLGLSCGCYSNWLLNTPEGKDKLDRSRMQGKKRSDKEIKKQEIKRKEESKSIAQLIQEARRPFQKLIRIRDHGQNCVCCDRPLPFDIGNYDAGHYLKAELYTGLIFHPDNVNGQLVHCNQHSHGNETGYADGILKRIGREQYEKLQSIKNKLKSYKWSRERLNNMKKYYNSELKLVEKGLKNINDVDLSVGIIKL